MSERPVIILGAGATKACGGPLTDELLPNMFAQLRESGAEAPDDEFTRLAQQFRALLRDSFHVPLDDDWRLAEGATLPALPLLLSLMDLAVDRGQPLGAFDAERIAEFRRVVQGGVFLSIVMALAASASAEGRDPHVRLLSPFYAAGAPPPTVITLNYDTLVDQAMVQLGASDPRRIPDFGCDVNLDLEPSHSVQRFGRLLKLHGSLSWLYCRRCARLALHMSGLKPTDGLLDALGDIFEDLALTDALVRKAQCAECSSALDPLLITPSNLKSYGNPHISRIWYEAGRALRRADRAIFVGYSLPWDDVEVIYLLRQGLEHLAPERITVVEYSPTKAPLHEHAAGKRYASLFGPNIDWQPLGFSGWLDDCERRGVSPVD